MKYLDIDFEFNHSSNYTLNLVCACFKLSDTEEEKQFWLHNEPLGKEILAAALKVHHDQGYTFRAYAATAECRSILSLGIDPREFKWIDLFFEFIQLQNCNDKYLYGTYFAHGVKHISRAPHINPRRNKGKNMNTIPRGVIGAVGRMLGVCRSGIHKDEMRDLILSNPKTFTPTDRQKILDYCSEDIRDLAALHETMEEPLIEMTGIETEDLHEVQLWRGRYAANLAHMERTGFPIDMPALENLVRNTDNISREAITACNKVYPFYRRKNTKEIKPAWSFSNAHYNRYVKESGHGDKWPKSEKTGAFKQDNETLEKYRFLPEIETLHQTKKLLRNLTWFADYEDSRFRDSMGEDGVLRPYFGPFGTQTGRNAPPASQFILAMSSWLRVLVRPQPGRAIISIDYKSQEFAIGAICSKDNNLANSYKSGDPYLAFAILCGAIPSSGTKESHPKERQLYKSVVLGLSYGMRAASLSHHISASIGHTVSEKEANKYIQQHEKVYKNYWKWREQVLRFYNKSKRYVLSDGWTLGGDNHNSLSVQNFPVQGVAQCVLRQAMDYALDEQVEVMSGLHDAIYAMAHESEAESKARTLKQCMNRAVKDVLWTDDPKTHLEIGLDLEIHYHKDDWVEDKGQTDYKNYKRFLCQMDTDQDLENKVLNNIYGGI